MATRREVIPKKLTDEELASIVSSYHDAKEVEKKVKKDVSEFCGKIKE